MEKIYLEGLCDPHVHFRGMEEINWKVVEDIIHLHHQGGVAISLPMPNTVPELTTAELVGTYHTRLEELAKGKMRFIRTAMLTEKTTLEELRAMFEAGIRDVKIYPRFRTTNSENGVRDYIKIVSLVQACGAMGIRLHVHPEHPWMKFHNRDAEFAFLAICDMLLRASEATIIWEHGTDGRCIPFWKDMAKTGRFYVTLTAHHLATDEDESFGDVRCVCKPPIKTARDRLDLVNLVAQGYIWVMAGSDFAPHPMEKKHVHKDRCACGACTGPDLASLYAHALDDMLQATRGHVLFRMFVSKNACRLYGLRKPQTRLVIERRERVIPLQYKASHWTLEPFWAGRTINWSHHWM